jgi:hypothetical protein
MLTVADVFKSNLFGTTSLTHAINEIAYVPQRLMELDLFEVEGINTTSAFIEKIGETLVLVKSTPRGGPGQSVSIDRREAVPFQASHLQLEDRIYADEIQNVRAFGTNNQLVGVEQVRDKRLLKMSRSLDLTLEYHRLGAIQGLVLDADGAVIDDLFDKFGIAEPADVGLLLEAAWTEAAGSPVKKRITGALRRIEAELGGFTPTGYHAFAGDDFFDALISHPETRALYLATAAAQELRGDASRIFSYGNVTWENYRGQGAVAIPTDEARIFPLGVPGLFAQLFAPADTMEAVNTLGQIKYALAVPDPSGKNKFIELEAQSNPITYCTRPKVLQRVMLGAAS